MNKHWTEKMFVDNPDLFKSGLVSRARAREDGVVQMTERRLDLENSRMHNVWKFYMSIDDSLQHLETFNVDHIVYNLHELKQLVESTGWTYRTCYGGFDLDPVQINSRRLVLVAVKP